MNATDPTATAAAAAAPRPLPDAFIYLPGLGGDLIDQSGAGIAKRLARELDRSAQSDTAKFFVDPKTREETFGGDQEKPLKTKAYAINRKDATGERKVVDLYELDYRPILTKRYQDENILRKAIRLVAVLLPNICRFLKALSFSRQEKKTAEKLQFIFAAGILALSVIYFISLGLAASQTAYQMFKPAAKPAKPGAAAPAPSTTTVPAPKNPPAGQAEPAATTPAPAATAAVAPIAPATAGGKDTGASKPPGDTAAPASPEAAATPKAVSPSPVTPTPTPEPKKTSPAPAPASAGPTLPVVIVILIAVLELFYPGLKQGWSTVAVEYLAAMEYVDPGTRKAVIGGQLTDLLECLAEKQEYRHIHLLAYSFGTLVALDNIFPAGGQPGARFAKLHTFITIGCPYDLIRLFWPQYFENRYGLPETPPRWLNIYSRMDILASNFRDDDQKGEAQIPLELLPELKLPACLPENIHYSVSQEPEKITFLNSLSPLNLLAHSGYWEHTFEAEITCFSPIIRRMYSGDAMLS